MLCTNKILGITASLLLICINSINAHNDSENLAAYSTSLTQIPVDYKNHSNAGLFEFRFCGHMLVEKPISGSSTNPFEYPWMAILQYKLKNDQLEQKCLGSIVTQRFILTTANCITGLPDDITLHSIVLGEHNIKTEYDCIDDDDCAPPAQTILVDRVIPHPAYNKSLFNNDIGLVRLQSLVVYHYALIPICLPITPETDKETLPYLTLLYWGRTEHVPMTDGLQQARLAIIPNDVCNQQLMQQYHGRKIVDATHVCTSGEDRTTCVDYEGAPAVSVTLSPYGPRFFLYGVALSGAPECQFNFSMPAIYTRISPYLGWILDTCDE